MNNLFSINKIDYSRRRQSGAALIELALVLIFFLIPFIFGSIELGRALMQQNQLSQRVEAASRFLSRGDNLLDSNCNAGFTGSGWSDALARAEGIFFYGTPVAGGGEATFFPALSEGDFNLSITVRAVAGDAIAAGASHGCIIRVAVSDVPFDSIWGGASIVPFFDIAPIHFSAASEGLYVRDF